MSTVHISKIRPFAESMNPTIFNALFDSSQSTNQLHKSAIVSATLNEIMIPAFEGADPARKDLLRVALGAFSDGKIQSLTKAPGYYTVAELRKNPVTNDRFFADGLMKGTALYASMISGIKSATEAAFSVHKDFKYDKVSAQVLVVTDGANCTGDPTKTDDVRKLINSIGKMYNHHVDLRVSLAYFKTNDGLSRPDFERVALACGLEKANCHFWAEHGSSFEEQKKAFRRLIKILSKYKFT